MESVLEVHSDNHRVRSVGTTSHTSVYKFCILIQKYINTLCVLGPEWEPLKKKMGRCSLTLARARRPATFRITSYGYRAHGYRAVRRVVPCRGARLRRKLESDSRKTFPWGVGEGVREDAVDNQTPM